MLNFVYRFGRLFMSRGWIVGLLLIVLTIGIGTTGFLDEKFDNGKDHSLFDALYKAASLLAIQTGSLPTSSNWPLELARWIGMLFFASALLTFAIRLSRESVHRLLVKGLAKDHVIVAGLGHNGQQLVEALRRRGESVIVLESDREHPAIEQCRQLGAIVLFGDPSDAATLTAANLSQATALLALFAEESVCVRVVTTAYSLLHQEQATSGRPPVRCVLRLTEPGLLDVIRRHKIKTDPDDRIQLEILNSHEITATTMVREARAISQRGSLGKLLILGLGTHHRLGEMVVLRAAKDHLILNQGKIGEKLIIDVFDKQASEWLKTFHSRYPFLERLCEIKPHLCWARKVGGTGLAHDYDAAFVCISDEGHATAQAVMLRREVLTNGQPIMVRVINSRSGYGSLIASPASGWGDNLHAVGLEDPLFDAATATQPELELRAQTIHQDYRARQKNSTEPANKPWVVLDETFREANRKLAERYAAHLASTDGKLKTVKYRWEFRPDGFQQIDADRPLLFQFSQEELESLAAREHFLWKEEREADGWRYGEVKDKDAKTNPLLVDYTKLTDEDAREYNREFVRRIPLILALADYTIVSDQL
jgi:hypothetical protein